VGGDDVVKASWNWKPSAAGTESLR